MHYILCQPAVQRFEWELEVFLTNVQSLGESNVILLFSGTDEVLVERVRKKYSVRCHLYPDDRDMKRYISSSRAYSWMRFLQEYPEMENEDFFYIDSDIIFREKIDFSRMDFHAAHWCASDCSSYLQPSYICSKGEHYFEAMCKIVGLSREQALTLEGRSGGAQWILSKPTAKFWEKVYHDSNYLYDMFCRFEIIDPKEKKETIQKWTSDMWALLWNAVYFGIDISIEKELDFCWPANEIEEWSNKKILHNAGVTEEMQGLFYKGKWIKQSPIGQKHKVDRAKCTYHYVKALEQVKK